MDNKDEITNRGGRYRARSRGSTSFGAWNDIAPSFSSELYQYESSVRTPNFRRLKRYQLPEHPYQFDVRRYWSEPTSGGTLWLWPDGSSAENQHEGWTNIYGIRPDMLTQYETYDPPIKNLAISRLRSQLSQSAGSLAVSVAEFDKTVAHVAHTANRLARAFLSLRKGGLGLFSDALGITVPVKSIKAYRHRFRVERNRGSDLLQLAAGTWLEYTYGWKPLLSDVYAQAENLANYLTNHQNVIREARGTAKGENTTKTVDTVSSSDWEVWTEAVMKTRYSYVVRYKVADPNGSIPQIFGLNNPLSVAWELIPFSFVADWFLPIGDFLEGLTSTSGLEFHSGSLTRRYEAFVHKRIIPKVAHPDQGGSRRMYLNYGDSMYQHKYGKSRTLLTEFPQPQFIPKNPLSVSHATSALALLQSVFRGSRSTAGSYRSQIRYLR